ncbi:unnamed protein product [Orchesella dallaii]|uniref:WD repeat-containing protein 18 n=1 Tax=Orchesella dallaii TaxID=48710 RepID=A0ABP1R8J8_9HEXA
MEVLISTDSSVESKTSLNLWNPLTGTRLANFRGPPAAPSSLAFIRDEGFAIVEMGKPFIHFWQYGTPTQTSRRILCSGKPGPMCISPDGNFLAVAVEEKISIWQAATGRIVTVINSAHYRPVTALKFNDDGTYLISGAQDGMVLAWQFLVLVAGVSSVPFHSWSDHTLAITGIHVGMGGRKAAVFTVGQDRSLKIYSLINGSLLLSVGFPMPLTYVVADAAETAVYAGGADGSIYQMKLGSPPRSIEHHVATESVTDFIFRKHNHSITALAISADGYHLASGDESGTIHIWDLYSRQAVKSIGNSKTRITNLVFWIGNPDGTRSGKKPTIVFPEVPKLIESNEDERQDKEKLVAVWNRFEQPCETDDIQYQRGVKRPVGNLGQCAEINELKMRLTKCELVNQKLHEFYVDQVLGSNASNVGNKKRKT